MSTYLGVKKIHAEAKIPTRGSASAAGYDLYSVEDHVIEPGARVAIATGLIFEIPAYLWMKIEARSGLAIKEGVTVLCGVVDSDYRGEVKVVLANVGTKAVHLPAGSRIAQAVFHPLNAPAIFEVPEVNQTERGEGGFGSTGLGTGETSTEAPAEVSKS